MHYGYKGYSGGKKEIFGHHACTEHDFTEDETEFLTAIEAFKQRTGKRFPTWTEALGVIRSLGYAKPSPLEEPRSEAFRLA